jgi:hypothetical protein
MHADIGIAGGRQKGILYRGGKVIASLPQEQLIESLITELKAIAAEDARLIAAGEPLPTGLGDGEPALQPLPMATA